LKIFVSLSSRAFVEEFIVSLLPCAFVEDFEDFCFAFLSPRAFVDLKIFVSLSPRAVVEEFIFSLLV
jgi:hypothetical protein